MNLELTKKDVIYWLQCYFDNWYQVCKFSWSTPTTNTEWKWDDISLIFKYKDETIREEDVFPFSTTTNQMEII